MDFFANTETEWLEFDGALKGWKVLLKREMDAGDQEDLENEMLGIDVQGKNGATDVKPLLRQGGLKLLELCVLKIVKPDGSEIPSTPQTLRLLNKAVADKIKKRIRELNPPLALTETAI